LRIVFSQEVTLFFENLVQLLGVRSTKLLLKISSVQVKTAYIEHSSNWENDFRERFNGTLRDNLLDGEYFYSLWEARVIVGQWVKHYNHIRPVSALGYRPTAPQIKVPNLIYNQPTMFQ